MSEFQDPPRLFDLPDTPEVLKSGLLEASSDGLGERAVDRVAAGVLLDLGAGAGSPPATGGAAPPTAAGFGAKVIAGLVGAGILAGGVWLATRSEEPRGEANVPSIPVPVEVVSEVATAPPPAEDTANVETPAVKSAVPKPASTRVKPSASAAASTLAEEHRLLRAARGALATEPKRALALAREHERRFPRGVLAQEREVITIQALAAMGEGEAARKKAEGFDEKYPGSPHRNRVDEVTDKKSSPVP
jgi:hypothetical protein